MECILNCGIQQGEFIELSPAQHLITATLVYGKETVQVDVKQTTTVAGLKSLLFTVYPSRVCNAQKMHKPINMNRIIAILDNAILKDDVVISTLSSISRHPIYFTYMDMKFHVRIANDDMIAGDDVRSCVLTYNQTVGDLRQVVSVSM